MLGTAAQHSYRRDLNLLSRAGYRRSGGRYARNQVPPIVGTATALYPSPEPPFQRKAPRP